MKDNKQLVTDALTAFSKGQYEEFLSYFADDVKFTLGGTSLGDNKINGKDALRKTFQAGFSGNPEQGYNGLVTPITMDIQQLFASDNFVIDVSIGHGFTTEGNRPYDNYYCRIWEFNQGKIISLMEFLDTAYFHQVVLQSFSTDETVM